MEPAELCFLNRAHYQSRELATASPSDGGHGATSLVLEDRSQTQDPLMLEPQSADLKLEGDGISFINRDHIVCVNIQRGEIVVTTTAGTKITLPASPATLEKFVDDLANHVESNFVSIASSAVSTN